MEWSCVSHCVCFNPFAWRATFIYKDPTWGPKDPRNKVTIQFSKRNQARKDNVGGQGRAARWDNCRRVEWSGPCGQHRRKPSGHFTHEHTHTHTHQLIDLLIK